MGIKATSAVVAFAAVLCASAPAQNNGQNPLAEQFFQSSLAVLKNGWNMLQKQGAPLANQLVQKFPKNYKDLAPTVNKFVKTYGQDFTIKSIEEKRNLVLEFWRLRSALNVAALVDPELLTNVIGIKLEEVKSLSLAFNRVHQKLKKLDPLFA
jgi:hypothetical protein